MYPNTHPSLLLPHSERNKKKTKQEECLRRIHMMFLKIKPQFIPKKKEKKTYVYTTPTQQSIILIFIALYFFTFYSLFSEFPFFCCWNFFFCKWKFKFKFKFINIFNGFVSDLYLFLVF